MIARSKGAGVRGGSTEIVGTSTGVAPSARSRADRAPACSLVRGTSTVQPNSGRVSNQDSRSRRSTAAPTTVTVDPLRPAPVTSAST